MPPPPDRKRDPVVGPDHGPEPPFPLRLSGPVIKGFGRGSKELGIPTANIPLDGLSIGGNSDLPSGIYYGWAGLKLPSTSATQSAPVVHPSIASTDSTTTGLVSQSGTNDSESIYPMVMSLGYNPFYKNTVRSVEVHVMHTFAKDFYDAYLNLSICGFIRPEYDYVSKELLIEDIRTDIEVAGQSLKRESYKKLKDDAFLREFPEVVDVPKKESMENL